MELKLFISYSYIECISSNISCCFLSNINYARKRVTTEQTPMKGKLVLSFWQGAKENILCFTATYFLLQRTNNLAWLRKFFIDLFTFSIYLSFYALLTTKIYFVMIFLLQKILLWFLCLDWSIGKIYGIYFLFSIRFSVFNVNSSH